MTYTYEVYDLKNQIIKTVDLGFNSTGKGMCCTIDHVYELLKNKQIISPIVNEQISLATIKILSLTNNINDKKCNYNVTMNNSLIYFTYKFIFSIHHSYFKFLFSTNDIIKK